MKNIVRCFLLLFVAFLGSSAMANSSSYYASLTTKVAGNCSGLGKVYASTSGTEDVSKYSDEENTAKSGDAGGAGETVTLYAFAKANEGYEFKGWSTSASGATSYESTDNPWAASLAASKTDNGTQAYTYYAYFKELTYDPFSITFAAPPEGCSYTVDGNAPVNLTGLTKVTKVTLATSDSSFNSWKINGTRVDTNPYTFSATANTTVEAEFLTADKVATVTTKDELVTALANTNLLKVQIPSNTTITIPSGETVTVPSGLNVVNDGCLLVMGTLVNNGKISGNGSYALSFIEISQGEVITPKNAFASYTAFRYCKTSVSTVATGTTSETAPGCAKKAAIRIAGASNWTLTTGSSPAAAVVTVNNAVALNKITAVDDAYDSVAAAINAAYPLKQRTQIPAENKFVVLLKDGQNVTSSELKNLNNFWFSKNTSDGDQIGSGFRVDCATYSFTVSCIIDSATLYLVNGTTITHSASKIYQSWGVDYVIGCTTKATVSINCQKDTATSRVYVYDCADFATNPNGTANILAKGYGYYIYTGGPYTKPSKTTNLRTVGGVYKFDPTTFCPNGYKGMYDEVAKTYTIIEKVVDYDCFINDENVAANQFATLSEAITGANGQTIKLAQDVGISADLTISKTAIIDLNGYTILGPGKITISSTGDLTIIDSAYDKGGAEKFAPAIDASGKLTVVYGTYTGALALKKGSTTTIYNGTFTSAVTVNSGATTAFKGGKFATSVNSYLGEGYQETKIGSNYVVGKKLGGSLTKQGGTSDIDERLKLMAVDSSLYTAYISKPTFSATNPSPFFAKAEADAAISPFSGYMVEVVVTCDRDLAAGTLGFNYIFNNEWPDAIVANQGCRVFSRIQKEFLTAEPKVLSTFLTDPNIKNALTIGIYNVGSATANVGAICDVELCLYNGNTKAILLDTSKFTLGARNNVAYRSVSGTPTFYKTLLAAITDASEGETIVLARESSASVAVSNAITIDTKGFALSGVTAGTGWSMTTGDNGKVSFAKKVFTIAIPTITGATPTIEGYTINDGTITVTYDESVKLVYTAAADKFFGDSKTLEIQLNNITDKNETESAIDKAISENPIKSAPAKIDSAYYATLAKAVEAADGTKDIVLLADCAEEIEVSKSITIDKNGFTLSGVTAGNGWLMIVTDDGKVTFKNVVTVVIPTIDGAVVEVKANDETLTPDQDGKVTIPYGANLVVTYTAEEGKVFKDGSYMVELEYENVTTENIPDVRADVDVLEVIDDVVPDASAEKLDPIPEGMATAATFAVTEAGSENYADFTATFTIIANKNVAQDAIVLAGQFNATDLEDPEGVNNNYDGEWIDVPLTSGLTAGEPYTVVSQPWSFVTEFVKTFNCGLKNVGLTENTSFTVTLTVYKEEFAVLEKEITLDVVAKKLPTATQDSATIEGCDVAVKYTLGTEAVGYDDWNVDFEVSSGVALGSDEFTLMGSNPLDGETMVEFPTFTLEANTPVKLLATFAPQFKVTYADLIAATTTYTCGVVNNVKQDANVTVKIVLSKEGEEDIVVDGSEFNTTLKPAWPKDWPADADDTVKTKFAYWKTNYGVDTFTGNEAAFLLNVAPDVVKSLTIDSIAVEGTTATVVISAGNIDLEEINGKLFVKAGDALDDMTDRPLTFTFKNGKATGSVDAKFIKAKIGFKAPIN